MPSMRIPPSLCMAPLKLALGPRTVSILVDGTRPAAVTGTGDWGFSLPLNIDTLTSWGGLIMVTAHSSSLPVARKVTLCDRRVLRAGASLGNYTIGLPKCQPSDAVDSPSLATIALILRTCRDLV